jgi:segregation and condensation protein B
MWNDETLKALIEGIIYVAPEPVSLDVIVRSIEGEERERVKASLQQLIDEYERPVHGIQIRQVAGGYKFASKPEHHEVLRKFVKSLKPPVRLSKPALETLAVIAYRQPVTLPEIEAIRGVDCGGVIHTLLEKKLVVTAGRKSVVGRPILYRTSRDFLVHFGLKDVSELPSLKEFEELARQALGSELVFDEGTTPSSEAAAVTAIPSAESAATEETVDSVTPSPQNAPRMEPDSDTEEATLLEPLDGQTPDVSGEESNL